MGKLFLDERNLQQLGLNQQNIATLRALTEFANLQATVETHSAILDPLIALTTYGLLAYTANDAFATRTITGPAAGITVANGDGVTANPTLALANDLAAVEGLSGTGIAVRTATDTWANRTLVAPAAGFSITNPAGIAGDITFALTNDLAALEGLSGTNIIPYRSAVDTWGSVTIGTGLSLVAGTLSTSGVATSGAVTTSGLTMSTARLLGRTTASTGAIEEISIGTNLTLAAGVLSAAAGVSEASNAQVWAGSSTTTYISPNRLFAEEVPQTATSSATITLDGTNGLNFEITLDTNAALANPSNFQTGRHGIIRITQDGTGGRTMTFGSNWRFAGGSPSLTSAAGSIDVITFFVWSASMIIAAMANDYSASTGTGNILLGGDMSSAFGDALLLGGDMQSSGTDHYRIQEA